jgi:hypothetical protein
VQTCSYDGFGRAPPIYPTLVEVTPGKLQKRRSAPQKHPVAKYAISELLIVI